MAHIVYGVFDNEAQADRALSECGTSETTGAQIQEGHWRDEDVQIGASQALWGGAIMGLGVGIAAALFAWMFLWPAAGVPLPAYAMIPMALAGSVFGLVAGAVAGASECNTELRALASQVDDKHRVVVTCEVDKASDAEILRDAFERGGGEYVHAA